MSRLRVILVVFSVTACLIFTIFLRTSASRMFKQHRMSEVEQKNLRQQLWQKQLRFECLVNPAGLPQMPLPADAGEDGST
ncbi:MAG: hypothetical protein L0Y36_03320 [Planctomycetales bacterium]|nr:hypothetical protein [Planctomycetales bacterium]